VLSSIMDILYAPFIIALISAILSFLISIVDKIVNNYGQVIIDINGGRKKLELQGGAPLLSSLSNQEIFVPSACGGRGSCGECKVKVLSDIGPVLPTEAPLLTDQQMKDGYRLSCQVKIRGDIQIELPEELFAIQKFKGIIHSIRDVTHDIKEVYIKLQTPDSISFTSGQYCQLVVPPYDKVKKSVQRAYSIASPPSDSGNLGFLIRLVPGGIATTYVHTKLNQGDSVELIGPFGDFYVRETDAIMLCIAGGSGMAPFKSIFNDMLGKAQTGREVWYFFGARTGKDLFYLDEMKAIEEKWDNFHFIPALSEPQEEDNWQGETGLITDVLDKYLNERIDKQKPQEGYLCGSPGMLDACIEVLKRHNIPEEKIYFDKFA